MRDEKYAVDNLYDMIMSTAHTPTFTTALSHWFFWGSQSQKAGMTMQNGHGAVTKCNAQGTTLQG